jgi:hypothetical protein
MRLRLSHRYSNMAPKSSAAVPAHGLPDASQHQIAQSLRGAQMNLARIRGK